MTKFARFLAQPNPVLKQIVWKIRLGVIVVLMLQKFHGNFKLTAFLDEQFREVTLEEDFNFILCPHIKFELHLKSFTRVRFCVDSQLVLGFFEINCYFRFCHVHIVASLRLFEA